MASSSPLPLLLALVPAAADGLGSARSGNLEKASTAERKLASLVDAASKINNDYWAKQVEVQRREVAAWISAKRGSISDAIATMETAALLEDSVEKDGVSPGPLTPAREMLAEMLALQNRPAESLKEYQAVLKIAPNRFNAMYGAACAAQAAENAEAAKIYFQKLKDFAFGDERPELVAARKKAAN